MVKVAVNGYGTIGKRVAEAVMKQDDMELVGVVKTRPDYLAIKASKLGLLYVPQDKLAKFEKAGIEVKGTVEDLLKNADIVIDATPGGVGEQYKPLYEKAGVKAVFQGGEKHEVAGFSFSSLCNYDEAKGKRFARVVSCNTTGLLRSICTLMPLGLRRVRAVIVRRGADPAETKRGPINAIVPNPITLSSHHGIDVKTVVDVDINTSAVVVPTTLMHLHIVTMEFNDSVSKDQVIELFERAPRIMLIDAERTGIKDTAKLVEWARDVGRKRYDIPELSVWLDSIAISGRELTFMQAVHQESIVVPENVDVIRAMFGLAGKEESIKKTDDSLGLVKRPEDLL